MTGRDITTPPAYQPASDQAAAAWAAAAVQSTPHAYLQRKRVEWLAPQLRLEVAHRPHFSSLGRGALMVPAYNMRGDIQTVQYIGADPFSKRGKMFHRLGPDSAKGAFFPVNPEHLVDPSKPIYFAEGIATAATVAQLTGATVVSCFGWGNIERVVTAFRERYPERAFVIAADNNAGSADGRNAGLEGATRAAEAVGAHIVMPALPYGVAKVDFNDVMVDELEGRAQPGTASAALQPQAARWVSKIVREKTPEAIAKTPPATREQILGQAGRYERLALSILAREAADLADLSSGRNSELNKAVYTVARWVAAGVLSEAQVRAAFDDAGDRNGMIDDDGAERFEATFQSALRAGWNLPIPNLDGDPAQAFENIPVPTVLPAGARPIPVTGPLMLPVASGPWLQTNPAPARRFVVPGWIPDLQITGLYGNGGVGKSLTAMQLCMASSCAGNWLGFQLEHRPAFFLTTEDEGDELHARFKEVEAALYPPGSIDLSAYYQTSLCEEESAALAIEDPANRNRVLRQHLLDRVEFTVRALGARLVVLDTLADLFAGDHNSNTQAPHFVRILRGVAREHQAAIVLCAHPSKAGMRSGTGDGNSAMWLNSFRSGLYMRQADPTEDGEERPDHRVISKTKANRGRKGEEITVVWRAGCFVREAGETVHDADGGHRAMLAEFAFLQLLAEFNTKGERVCSFKSSRSAYAPKVFNERPAGKSFTIREHERAMRTLFQQGKINEITSGPPSKRSPSLVVVSTLAGRAPFQALPPAWGVWGVGEEGTRQALGGDSAGDSAGKPLTH